MVKSMRTRFDEQLRQLNVELIRMGSLCEEAISIAAKVLEGEKNISNERVFAIEGEIDQLEHDIESLCMRMLLQQQPVASDLRVISAALKMISDMERIGDPGSRHCRIVPIRWRYPGAGQTAHHQYGKGSGFDGHRKRGSICTG